MGTMTLLEISQITFYLTFSVAILVILFLWMVIAFSILEMAKSIKKTSESLKESSERFANYISNISILKMISKIFKGRYPPAGGKT
jgi:L-asparagine transporter-like permease